MTLKLNSKTLGELLKRIKELPNWENKSFRIIYRQDSWLTCEVYPRDYFEKVVNFKEV